MNKKPSIRKMTEAEILEIDEYSRIAIKEADRKFPCLSEQDKEDNTAYYHELMDDEMISRGLRISWPPA